MMVSKRNLLFQALILRFHVKLPGCMYWFISLANIYPTNHGGEWHGWLGIYQSFTFFLKESWIWLPMAQLCKQFENAVLINGPCQPPRWGAVFSVFSRLIKCKGDDDPFHWGRFIFQGRQRKAQRRWWRREAWGGHRDVKVGGAGSWLTQEWKELPFWTEILHLQELWQNSIACCQGFSHLNTSIINLFLVEKYMTKLIFQISMSNI